MNERTELFFEEKPNFFTFLSILNPILTAQTDSFKCILTCLAKIHKKKPNKIRKYQDIKNQSIIFASFGTSLCVV